MWLSGIPGSGKAVLCSSIIDNIARTCALEGNNLLLYFFFDYAARDKRIVHISMRSLLSQILVRRKNIPEPVQSLFIQQDSGLRQPDESDLISTLFAILRQSGDTYLILDALGECGQRTDLLEAIETIAGWNLYNVHMLATSRTETDIEEAFVRMKSHHLRLEGEEVHRDIHAYASSRILKDPSLTKWPAKVQQEILEAVTVKAGDMFRL